MKLEPVAVMDRDGDVYKSLPTPNWHPPHTNLYSEAQLIAEIEHRDAVLRLALDTIESIAVDRGLRMTAVEEEIRRVLG